MQPIEKISEFVRYQLLVLLTVGISSTAFAQASWIDVIPQLRVGCRQGKGKVENIDFSKLRESAKSAGATEIGVPFLSKAEPVGDGSGEVNWEACVVYKGAFQPTTGFQTQVFPGGPGVFTLCQGTDAKACAASALAWVKSKFPDFSTPVRVTPVWDYAQQKVPAIKASVAQLVSATTLIQADDSPSKVPDPTDDLDKELYGVSRQPRPLLSGPAQPVFTPESGGKQSYSGVLVFVPISDSQKTILEAP